MRDAAELKYTHGNQKFVTYGGTKCSIGSMIPNDIGMPGRYQEGTARLAQVGAYPLGDRLRDWKGL